MSKPKSPGENQGFFISTFIFHFAGFYALQLGYAGTSMRQGGFFYKHIRNTVIDGEFRAAVRTCQRIIFP